MDGNLNAAQFKATCLAVLDEVATTRRPVVVTKHGKPVAKLVPIERDELAANPLAGSIVHEENLTQPAHEVWGG